MLFKNLNLGVKTLHRASSISFNSSINKYLKKQFNSLERCQVMFFSTAKDGEQLLVKAFGDPVKVVDKLPYRIADITHDKQVLVKILASPVNPADINTIQGVYAIKPDFPFIPGNEAAMEVIEIGLGVKNLQVGDKVIPNLNALGTWRTMAVVSEDDVIKVPSDMDTVIISTISVNPCTAYRMLTDFVKLEKGETIIQNCANSAVGQAVIQIAFARGIQTINIVRDRPDLQNLKSFLKDLGASTVVTEEEIRSLSEIKKLPKPVLALNGVSGRPATDMMRLLANGGTMVTYGGMSKQPVTIPIGSLIFNDIIFRGFWMTRWNKQHVKDAQRMSMLEDLFVMAKSGKLKPPPHTLVPVANYKQALSDAMPSQGKLGKKQILFFE